MWIPDDLDIRIIKEMISPHSFQWDPRISYAHLAKRLAVDEETIRNRLRRMRDIGFLQGWQLIVNPTLLGREAAIVELRLGESVSKGELISRLSLINGVTHIDDFYGNELAVHLFYENQGMLTRQVQLIASLGGCSAPVSWRLSFPACEMVPTRTDWRVIRTLRGNARGKLLDAARSLRLSTRTVRRHLERLVDGNAFYLDPVLNLAKIGGLRARFRVACEATNKRAVDAKILSELNRIVWTHTAPEDYSLFVVHCANAKEIRDVSQWLEKLKGVREVRSNIDMEHIHIQGWLDGEIERRFSSPSS